MRYCRPDRSVARRCWLERSSIDVEYGADPAAAASSARGMRVGAQVDVLTAVGGDSGVPGTSKRRLNIRSSAARTAINAWGQVIPARRQRPSTSASLNAGQGRRRRGRPARGASRRPGTVDVLVGDEIEGHEQAGHLASVPMCVDGVGRSCVPESWSTCSPASSFDMPSWCAAQCFTRATVAPGRNSCFSSRSANATVTAM